MTSPFNVKQIFHGIGHACQRWQYLAACTQIIYGLRFLARPQIALANEGVHRTVGLLNPFDAGLRHLKGADIARSNGFGQLKTCYIKLTFFCVFHGLSGTTIVALKAQGQ